MSFFDQTDVDWLIEIVQSDANKSSKRKMLLGGITPLRFVTETMLRGYRREDLRFITGYISRDLITVIRANLERLDDFPALFMAAQPYKKMRLLFEGLCPGSPLT